MKGFDVVFEVGLLVQFLIEDKEPIGQEAERSAQDEAYEASGDEVRGERGEAEDVAGDDLAGQDDAEWLRLWTPRAL
ncbi:hypothetical protein BJG92_02380 [Arthrobacter sp. SO5]|uniref:hypothetical protein n=1 Tax=Arthrobacter sp. SO5 TaxID=1897055 RepID=UPI001E29BC1F|nr:hypothetical protein [Arthrobacter sp. SO5]MCB5274843.1 hypothetical protein [Arthrobacter sp. SO5]